MTWLHTISDFEYYLAATFLLFYLLYIIRMLLIARRLKTGVYAILFKLILRSAYFALFIIALLGPLFGAGKKEVKVVSKDIFIAVDLSESMNATDIRPSRMVKLKFELKSLIDAFKSDRVGMVIFSSEAFVQCPLTYDHSALGMFIESLNTDLLPSGGTDFGPALTIVLKKFEEDEVATTESNAKVLLVISDGEDFGNETDAIIKKVNDFGIKVFALGIGSEAGSTIPTRNGYKLDKEGKPVLTQLNPESLRYLTQKTGGEYFEISPSKSEMTRLITSIKKIEGKVRDVKKVDVSTNKFYYPLLLALVLMILDLLVKIRVLSI